MGADWQRKAEARAAADEVLENLGDPALRERLEEQAARPRLADLPREQHRDTLSVLRHLQACGRYTSFEQHATTALQETLERIVRWGLVHVQQGPLWQTVELTARGRHLLARTWAPPLKGRG